MRAHIATDVPSLLASLEAAVAGDTVLLAPGTYALGAAALHIRNGVRAIGSGADVTRLEFAPRPIEPGQLCCVNLLPGAGTTELSGVWIDVALVKGVLCAPLGCITREPAYLGTVMLRDVVVQGSSDGLYFNNQRGVVVARDCSISTAFELVYLYGSMDVRASRCRFTWRPDPERTGLVCITAGQVGGEATLALHDCTLAFDAAHAPPNPYGILLLSRRGISLRRTRVCNPLYLPVCTRMAHGAGNVGHFTIDDSDRLEA
jgi:hypothetical protein